MSAALFVHPLDPSADWSATPELATLAALAAKQVPVAPFLIVPGQAEELFYRSNNLVPQLVTLFTGLNLADPDEDELEDVAPEAMRLIEQHYLLDEFIDSFYEQAARLPAALRVRRLGTAGVPARRGRASLLALKRLWAADWTVAALFERLSATGSVELAERPVLLHELDEPVADSRLLGRVQTVLGRAVPAWSAGGALTRLEL